MGCTVTAGRAWHGEIEVTVRVAESQCAPDATIVFSVRGTGIGNAPDQLRSIFESFSRADSSTTRK